MHARLRGAGRMDTPHHTLSLSVHTTADAEAKQLRDGEGAAESPERSGYSEAKQVQNVGTGVQLPAKAGNDLDDVTQIEEAELANVRSQAPQSPPDTSPTPQ